MFPAELDAQIDWLSKNKDRLLGMVLDSTPTAVLVKNSNGKILWGNGAAARVLGQDKPSELIGKSISQLWPVLGERLDKEDRDVMASNKAMTNLRLNAEVSGEIHILRYDKIPLIDEVGLVVGVIVLAIDISESLREQMEEYKGTTAYQIARYNLKKSIQQLRSSGTH